MKVELSGTNGAAFSDSITLTYTDSQDDVPGVSFVVSNNGKIIEGEDAVDVTFTRTGDVTNVLTIDELVISKYYTPGGSVTPDLLSGVVCDFDQTSITFPAGSSAGKVLKFSCTDDSIYQPNYKLVINAKASNNGFSEAIATRVDVEVTDPKDLPRVEFGSGTTYSAKEGKTTNISLKRLGDTTSTGTTSFGVSVSFISIHTISCTVADVSIPATSDDLIAQLVCDDEGDLNLDYGVTIKITSHTDGTTIFPTADYYSDESVRLAPIDYEDNDVSFIKFTDSLTLSMDEVDSSGFMFARGGDTSVAVEATLSLESNVASCSLTGTLISYDAGSSTPNQSPKLNCVDDVLYSNAPVITVKLAGIGSGVPFDDSIGVTYTDNQDDAPGVGLSCANELLERNESLVCTVTRTGDITKALVVNRLEVTGSSVCSFSRNSINFGANTNAVESVVFKCMNDLIYQSAYAQSVAVYADDNGFGEPASSTDSINIVDEMDKPRIIIKQIVIARIKEGSGFEVVIARKGDVNHSISTSLTLEENFGSCTITPETASFGVGETDPIVAKINCPAQTNVVSPSGSAFSLVLDGDDAAVTAEEKKMEITYIDLEEDDEDDDTVLLLLVAGGACVVCILGFFVFKNILAGPADIGSESKSQVGKEPAISNDPAVSSAKQEKFTSIV
eukprot:TRINITY_DN510_c0_g2_i1.p1 TRINITY_DN510_c0_g2~~TRINITY_DN510_c0_g2_i1.p1  ORF type:complete len:673 (-),score=279.36 TRINITY_DN510_c0_g2_i1:505-2523(-)